MAIEQIATATSKEAPKIPNPDLTKIDAGNKIDYSLDKVDEQKFNEYKKMTDYIKENGGEYGKEYNDIMEKAIKPFEKQIKDILNKSNVIKENKDLDKKSDEEIAREADERMKNQPEELKQQRELIKKINGNGSSEEIQKLNEIVNNNMADVQSFYERIAGQTEKKQHHS